LRTTSSPPTLSLCRSCRQLAVGARDVMTF
jgi:hypothetical protein